MRVVLIINYASAYDRATRAFQDWDNKIMYICMCNPFTDKDLDSALLDERVKNKTSAVYQACTGGEKPCCGTCICEIKDRIDAHNEDALLMAAE